MDAESSYGRNQAGSSREEREEGEEEEEEAVVNQAQPAKEA